MSRDLTPVFTAIVAASACGGSTPPPGVPTPDDDGTPLVQVEPTPDDTEPPEPPEVVRVPPQEAQLGDSYCVDGEPYVGPIRATTAYDYIELLRVSYAVEVVVSDGEACASGESEATCNAALKRLRDGALKSFPRGPMVQPEHLLLIREGQTRRVLREEAELRRFFGLTDTATEALFWALRGHYRLVCDDQPNFQRRPGGYHLRVETGHVCGSGAGRYHHDLMISGHGDVVEERKTLVEAGNLHCFIGRLPSSGAELEADPSARATVARFLAEVAYLEASAVLAFDELVVELETLGAPAELVEWAQQSRTDEVRHAQLMGALAVARGAVIQRPSAKTVAPRDAFTIALHNAEEGCVRESYGAVVALHQAQTAQDPELRAAAKAIAADECRHASFSWALHAWLCANRLTAAQHEVVSQRIRLAAANLRSSDHAHPPDVASAMGMPTEARAQTLLDGLDAALWRAA